MALGRGLDALLGDTTLQAQTGGSVNLPISQVEPGLNQPRKHFDEEALADLAESIRQHGMLQPLTVRRLASGYYQIIAGERRWRAARQAGLEEVPAIIIEADDRKVMELGLIENLQREDLNPMEEAAGYRTLIQDYGLTQEEAARRVSKSRPAVANAMRLLALPQEVQWLIEQGNLSAGHGRALLALPTPEAQIAFAGEIVDKGYSVRETEQRIRQAVQKKPAPPPEPHPLQLYYAEAERQLTAGLGRRVTISPGKKKGKIALEYYDQEDLNRLLQALSSLEAERNGIYDPRRNAEGLHAHPPSGRQGQRRDPAGEAQQKPAGESLPHRLVLRGPPPLADVLCDAAAEPLGPAGPQRLHLQQPGGGRPPAGEPAPAVRAGGAEEPGGGPAKPGGGKGQAGPGHGVAAAD